MTALEVLTIARARGIRVEPKGNRLRIEAPAGALTPDLKRGLATHKVALLEVLSTTTQHIVLKGGLIVPADALRLVWSLEDRGIVLQTVDDHQLVMPQDTQLSDEDRAQIARWRRHLGAIAEYEPPEVA